MLTGFCKGARGRGMRIATASVRTGFAMTGGFTRGAVQAGKFAFFPEKTNTAPTAAKDDALHRDTTLLRRPLTQNGLTECRYTPALSRAPPFGSEAALRPSTRRLRSHVPPSVPRPLSPARALFGGLKWGTLSFTAFYDPVKFFKYFSPCALRGEKRF